MQTINERLEHARARLDRVPVESLEDEIAAGAVVVDIRPAAQRSTDGTLAGALVIDRNVLEWRLARSSEHRALDVGDGQRVIVVCNEGYQSSLAAATLKDLGIAEATDLIGGFQAYLGSVPT